MFAKAFLYRVKHAQFLRLMDVVTSILAVLTVLISIAIPVLSYYMGYSLTFSLSLFVALFLGGFAYLTLLSCAFPEFGAFNRYAWNDLTVLMHDIWLRISAIFVLCHVLVIVAFDFLSDKPVLGYLWDLWAVYKYGVYVVVFSWSARLVYGVFYYIRHGKFVYKNSI